MPEELKLLPKMLASEAAIILDTSIQNVHKKLKEKNLPTEKSQNRVYFGHSTAKQLFNFNFDPKIFSFQLVKGGVGKTVVSYTFSVRSALLGAKVAIIELDQQANLTRSFGVNAKDKAVMIDILNDRLSIEDHLINVIDGIDILPSRVDNAVLDNTLMLKKLPLDKVFAKPLNKLKEKYDVIVIDCPPSIGASVSAAALASDVIVMPVNPTDYSIAGLELTYKELSDLFSQYDKTAEFKILFNKFDGRTTLSFNIMSDLIKHKEFGSRMLSCYVRATQTIENAVSTGKSIFDSIKSSPEKEDFSTVTKELLGLA